ncbi:MAG: phenylalanine 4-monooxygenase, partial [Moraxella sp.]|nr:phenylalanine 4-monooxygenase [Moraxella sp.]
TRVFLARLYWFTMEFGLMDTPDGLRIYGGGILSSPAETNYALSGEPEYRPFDLNTILRTPYRIDKIQPIYYVIDSPDVLFNLNEDELISEV